MGEQGVELDGVTTLEKLFQPQVKWIRSQTAHENLKKEQWLHECKGGDYRDLDQIFLHNNNIVQTKEKLIIIGKLLILKKLIKI